MDNTIKLIISLTGFVFLYIALGKVLAITFSSAIIGSYFYFGSNNSDKTKAPSTPDRKHGSNARTPPTGRREARSISKVLKQVKGAFDPEKSSVSALTMEEFLAGPRSKDMNLEDFPGVGPKLAKALTKDGVGSALELVKKFRGFSRECDGDTYYTCNAFYDYLKGLRSKYPRVLKGNANCHDLTRSVAHYADMKCSWFKLKLGELREENDL